MVTENASRLASTVTVSVAVLNLICSCLRLVARILSTTSSFSLAVTFDSDEASIPSIMFHLGISSAGLLDILTIVLAILYLLAALKDWFNVILLSAVYTVVKIQVELVVALGYRGSSERNAPEDQTNTVWLGNSLGPIILMWLINVICTVLVLIFQFKKEKSLAGIRASSLDEGATMTQCPPSYDEAIQRHCFTNVESTATWTDQETPPPYSPVNSQDVLTHCTVQTSKQ